MDIGIWSFVSFAAAVLLLQLLGKILSWPTQRLSRLILNSLLGALVLVMLNLFGSWVGLRIAINPLNAVIVGVLGIPGVVLLLVLPLMLS